MSAEVEIYVRCDCTALKALLATLAHEAPSWRTRRQERLISHTATLWLSDHPSHATSTPTALRALIVENAADGFHSLLLTAPQLPWADDLALARQVLDGLTRTSAGEPTSVELEIRCNASAWQPGDDEDAGWLAVTASGERPIRWRSA